MQNCENAVPIFKKRFQTIGALVQIYEQHYGWENGVFKGNPNNLDLSFDDANSDDIEITKITPELQNSQAVAAGLARLTGAGGALDNCLGALDLNDNLETFLEAATNCSEISTNALLSQLKTDLIATDQESVTASQAVNAAIETFNNAVSRFPESIVAKQFDIDPIDRSSGSIPLPSWGLNN